MNLKAFETWEAAIHFLLTPLSLADHQSILILWTLFFQSEAAQPYLRQDINCLELFPQIPTSKGLIFTLKEPFPSFPKNTGLNKKKLVFDSWIYSQFNLN